MPEEPPAKSDIQRLETSVAQLRRVVENGFVRLDGKIDATIGKLDAKTIEKGFDHLDSGLDSFGEAMNSRFDSVDASFDRLISKLDRAVANCDLLVKMAKERSRRTAKLERW